MSGQKQKREQILIMNNSAAQRKALSNMLSDKYDIIEAESGEAAVELLQKSSNEISLVMLDVLMPGIDGYEVLECMNRYGIIEDVPVIMLSTETSTDFITKAYDLGAMDYVSRPFASAVVQRRV